jgi:hypothetical protein
MSFFNKVAISLKKELAAPKTGSSTSLQGYEVNASDPFFSIPKNNNKAWYQYGPKDATPIYLEDLAMGSAVHNAILKTKSMMISGDGILLNGAEYKTGNAELDFLLKNKHTNIPYQVTKDYLADNYSLNGAFAYLCTFNKDFTKVASYKPLMIKYLRAAVPPKGEKVQKYYYYEGDWSKAKASDLKEYYIYDRSDREHYDQIVYEKDGPNEIYGVPTYRGGIRWINIDIEMGVFHEANIKNGMNPGLHFKFYTVPETEEQKQSIISDIKTNWMGAINTGRFVPTFSPNKELATEVTPIEASQMDKQLLNLTELCDRKVLSAHQLTSPLLAGISVSGSLGANVELKTAWTLWNKTVIAKMAQRIDQSLTKHIFAVNMPNQLIETKPFDPLAGIL